MCCQHNLRKWRNGWFQVLQAYFLTLLAAASRTRLTCVTHFERLHIAAALVRRVGSYPPVGRCRTLTLV